jgi:hypothetical protein
MRIKLQIFGILTILCVSWAGMQAQVSPSTGSNTGGPESSSTVGKDARFGQLMNQQTGSLQFFGKVAMAAGRLPWDPIPVVVTCGDKARYNTVADAKGAFYIVRAGGMQRHRRGRRFRIHATDDCQPHH